MATLLAQRPFNQGNPPDPATMVQRRVKFLTTLLSLTDAQASQATTIFTNAQTAASSLETSLRDARQAMAAAVKNNDTAAIDTQATSAGTMMGQLMAIQGKANAAFYAILTADQKTKFDQLGHGFGPGFGPGGMGGGMGPMGGRAARPPR